MKCYSGLRSAWGLLGLCMGLFLLLLFCSSFVVRKGDRYASDAQWDLALASYRDAAVSAKKDSHVAKASVDRV
jgi:hypothetical protein